MDMMGIRRGVMSASSAVSLEPSNVVMFTTPKAAPLKKCIVRFGPVSGGLTKMDLTITGKNIASDNGLVNNYFINASGGITHNTVYKYLPTYIPVLPDTDYAIQINKGTTQDCTVTVPMYGETRGFLTRVLAMPVTVSTGFLTGGFTTTHDTRYIRFSAPRESSNIGFELGSSVTAFESYSASVISANWSGSITTGYVDFVNGIVVDEVSGIAQQITLQTILTRAGFNSVYADYGTVDLEYWLR